MSFTLLFAVRDANATAARSIRLGALRPAAVHEDWRIPAAQSRRNDGVSSETEPSGGPVTCWSCPLPLPVGYAVRPTTRFAAEGEATAGPNRGAQWQTRSRE